MILKISQLAKKIFEHEHQWRMAQIILLQESNTMNKYDYGSHGDEKLSFIGDKLATINDKF